MVVLGQVIAQGHQRRKVKRAAFDVLEHDRESPRQPGRGETPETFALTQPKLLGAELEHRRVACAKVEPALFDLSEVKDEPRQELALGAQQQWDLIQELVVGELSRRMHASGIHPSIFELSGGPRTRD